MVMVRITKVYTGGGDQGQTSLVDGTRVAKSDSRMAMIGNCDEVNSWLGMEIMEINRSNHEGFSEIIAALSRIQNELFDLGAELACPRDKVPEYMALIGQESSDRLCDEMDAWNEDLAPLSSFILPTGSALVSTLHVARCMTRRLERSMVVMKSELRPLCLQYINRLSDWIFILARAINSKLGEEETLWVPLGQRISDR
jgi:cob(I)alamin adenosyltransferase